MSAPDSWMAILQQQSLIANAMPSLAAVQQPFVCALTDYQILRMQGADAERFMQGQFTNDLRELSTGQSQLNACCNPKGRMLAQFRIAKVGDEYWLRLPKSVAQPLQEHLQKYMVFFKAKLALDEELVVLGVNALADGTLDMNLPDTLNATISIPGGCLVRTFGTQPRFEIWTQQPQAAALWSQIAAQCAPAAASSWELTEVLNGVGDVVSATREEFIPQMLNLQSLGGVSFKKGCYTGQEIVARMQHLGTLKKRMFHIQAATAEAVPANTGISAADGSNVGTLVRAVNTADSGLQGLAVLALESVSNQAPLFLAATGEPLPIQVSDVPYPVNVISNPRKKL